MSEEGGGTTGPGKRRRSPRPIRDDPRLRCILGGLANGEPPEEMSVGELVFEISDRASVLIREEIELAKTEVTEKLNRLMQGSVVALVAGVFVLAGAGDDHARHRLAAQRPLLRTTVWAGFLIEARFFLLIAAGAGLFAYRSFKKSSPPTPDMAIEEAKEFKASFDKRGER